MSIREQFGKQATPETPSLSKQIECNVDTRTDACEPAPCEPVDDRTKSAVDENVLQEPTRFDSMSYTNDLTDEDVEKVIELHAEQIRTGFRKKEISAKWLARVLMRSNKTLCERYGRGTSVSEIVSKELSAKSDDLKDRLMELTPSARAKLLAELGIGQ